MSNTLKITTIGNSAGVILPKELLEKLRVAKGDTLYAAGDTERHRIDAIRSGIR